MIDVRALTYEEYRALRLLAALERAYPGRAPAAGQVRASDLVKSYEELRR